MQAVLRLWLPAELHRLARDASISDMHCNDFLYTLVLTRADITAEIESFEVDEPHLIWGRRELGELQAFLRACAPVTGLTGAGFGPEFANGRDKDQRAPSSTGLEFTSTDPTKRKVKYSRLRQELLVGEVYVSAFLRGSRIQTDSSMLSMHVSHDSEHSTPSRRSNSRHSRNSSTASTVSLVASRTVLSQLRNPKIFLKALIRRLWIEAGQRRRTRSYDMISSQTTVAAAISIIDDSERTQAVPASDSSTKTNGKTGEPSTNRQRNAEHQKVYLSTVGAALKTLVSSVVRSNSKSAAGTMGGVIEYDDVRKFVQLIRRLAQQRLQPLRNAVDVRMQRSSTDGSEAFPFLLPPQQQVPSADRSARSLLDQDSRDGGSGPVDASGQDEEDRSAGKEYDGNSEEEDNAPEPLSQSPPDSPSSFLQSSALMGVLFSTENPIDAGRCLCLSGTLPSRMSNSSLGGSKNDALRMLLGTPTSDSAEVTCVELLSTLIERDGGKNGLASYACRWARKTGSLWDALIAAAQPVRLGAIAPLTTFNSVDSAAAQKRTESSDATTVQQSDRYMPHFSHTTAALKVMRALLSEILTPTTASTGTSRLSKAERRAEKKRGDGPDSMSAFVARAIRGEQVIPFLVSICRKDAEIAGRGRKGDGTGGAAREEEGKYSEASRTASRSSAAAHRGPRHAISNSGEWQNILGGGDGRAGEPGIEIGSVDSPTSQSSPAARSGGHKDVRTRANSAGEMIPGKTFDRSGADFDEFLLGDIEEMDPGEDIADDILNLLSKDSRCGVIVQARRAVVRRGMYPGYDDDESKVDLSSEMPTVDMSSHGTTVRSSRWSRFTAKSNRNEALDPHAATIPPSSTISGEDSAAGNRVVQHRPPSSSDFRFPSDFKRKYKMGVIIGEGASCEVRECIALVPSPQGNGGRGGAAHRQYAVKQVPKRYFSALASSQRGWQRILDEVEMQQKMSHESIVEVRDVFEDKDYLYVVLELMQGGDLLDRLLDRIEAQQPYTESEVRVIFAQLLGAIKYLHQGRGITHRDIKPENILLSSPTDDTDIKLADFGAACWSRQRGSARMRSYVGSPQVSVNVVSRPHPC